jgi:hypothetical protein
VLVLADQVLPIPYLEGGLVGAMEHQCRPGLVGAMEHQCRRGSAWAMEHQCRPDLAWASEEVSVVDVVLDVVGRDGVAIMVTPGGKFTTLLRR